MSHVANDPHRSPEEAEAEAPAHALHRVVFLVVGAGLVAAALALWAVPARHPDLPALMLFKLGLTAFMALGGLGLIGLSRARH
ncbi:hypothetical protein ROJ8625_01345 [Roseivivax jejudonensis]|uniref:Uncharacterized protein n=1 Tax=Roseivivax jejudonensis TaxID=1529041 RepID=A0A1X6YT58_9RHOB|nr:hypothetical protein [Roseivivax jejudonensis]SLN30039.1 hypothetical protein ROJ8625_01345 [Roseivivax jejudonensis]